MKIQLWAYVPGSDDHTILADPLNLQATCVMSDVGSMQLTYPLYTPHAELLSGMSGGAFVGCDVEIRVWNGSAWILPPQCRFEVTDYEDDFTSQRDMPTRTYTLQSWSARPLWSVRQGQITGLNSQGARDFINKSRGEIAGILITEAQARGDVPNLTYLNSAGTGGDAISVPPGQTLQDILANARDEGVLEWLMVADASDQGRKLVCYSSLGTDLSDTVVLQDGQDIRQAPSHWSTQDMAQAVLVQGDDNAFVVSVSPDAASPYGKNMDFVTASGITDPTALDLIGQARLEKGKQPRVEHTRDLIFDDARFLPFIDYSLGDTILAPAISGEMRPLRVRQITLSLDSDGVSGNLVLGDRFTERALQIERATRGIAAGAGSLGGSGTLPDNTGSQIDTALDDYDNVVQGIVAGKVRYESSAPGSTPGNADDTWFQTSGGKTVAIYVHNGTSWVQTPINETSLAVSSLSALSANLGTVNAGVLNSVYINGTTITGGTIVGPVIKAVANGGRIELEDTSSGPNRSVGMMFYSYAGASRGGIMTGAGLISLVGPGSSGIDIDGSSVLLHGTPTVPYGDKLLVQGNLVVAGTTQIASLTATAASCSSLTASGNVAGNQLKMSSPPSTSIAANVYYNSSNSLLYLTSSRSALKYYQKPIKAHYGLLDLPTKTWIDKAMRREIPGYEQRTAGATVEDIEALSAQHGGVFDPLLSRDPVSGEAQGIDYDRITAYLLPVVADMHRRLTALEDSHAA